MSVSCSLTLGYNIPAHDIRLGYILSEPSSYLTLGRNTPTQGVRLGYALSEPSSYLISGRDAPTQGIRLGVYVILVLGGLLLVIFTIAIYVYLAIYIRSAGV